MKMFSVVSLSEAIDIILKSFPKMADVVEEIPILNSLDRTCADDIISKEDVPLFNRSTVDGYAVVSNDTFGASEAFPAILTSIGEIGMGEVSNKEILNNETIYVPTGGQIPKGSDSMVMIEYTDKIAAGEILVFKASAPGENITLKGEDVKMGDIVIPKDTKIRPQEIGIMASLGIENVLVKRKPKAGIISTGDEIVPINNPYMPGKVRDINSYTNSALLTNIGFEVSQYGIIGDDKNKLVKTINLALDECDAVFISGGSSVGTKDITICVLEEIEHDSILFHGIAIKPGKPTICANIKGKPVIGLPGHPAAALMINILISNVVKRSLLGLNQDFQTFLLCEMTENYPSNNGREELIPVKVEQVAGIFKATPVHGKSGLISILSHAWGYILLSRDKEGLQKNEVVSVFKF